MTVNVSEGQVSPLILTGKGLKPNAGEPYIVFIIVFRDIPLDAYRWFLGSETYLKRIC